MDDTALLASVFGKNETPRMQEILLQMKHIENQRQRQILQERKEKIKKKLDIGMIRDREDSQRTSALFGTGMITDLLKDGEEHLLDMAASENIKKLQTMVEKTQIKIIESCDDFSNKFGDIVGSSKEKMEAELLESFKDFGVKRMPNVFIRSIKNFVHNLDPKTQRALQLFEKYPRKRQNTIIPRFDEDHMREVSAVIKQIISKSYVVAIELIRQLMSSIKVLMAEIREQNEEVSEIVKRLDELNDKVQDCMTSCRNELRTKRKILDSMYEEMDVKKIQKSILQGQFNRRKVTFENERREFLRELDKTKGVLVSGIARSSAHRRQDVDTEIREGDSEELMMEKLKMRHETVVVKVESERKELKEKLRKKLEKMDRNEQEVMEEFHDINSKIIMLKNSMTTD